MKKLIVLGLFLGHLGLAAQADLDLSVDSYIDPEDFFHEVPIDKRIEIQNQSGNGETTIERVLIDHGIYVDGDAISGLQALNPELDLSKVDLTQKIAAGTIYRIPAPKVIPPEGMLARLGYMQARKQQFIEQLTALDGTHIAQEQGQAVHGLLTVFAQVIDARTKPVDSDLLTYLELYNNRLTEIAASDAPLDDAAIDFLALAEQDLRIRANAMAETLGDGRWQLADRFDVHIHLIDEAGTDVSNRLVRYVPKGLARFKQAERQMGKPTTPASDVLHPGYYLFWAVTPAGQIVSEVFDLEIGKGLNNKLTLFERAP